MTSQRLGIERFSQVSPILLAGFLGHPCEQVPRAREEIIPPALGFELCQHKGGERLSLFIRELGLSVITFSIRLPIAGSSAVCVSFPHD